MPNRRGIPGAGPTDSTADVVLMNDDVAERGATPAVSAMRSSRAAASVRGGQDLGQVIAEPGDLGCRLLVSRRPRQTPIRPVIGDCRHMRHHVPDPPAGTGRDGGAQRRVINFEMRSLVS